VSRERGGWVGGGRGEGGCICGTDACAALRPVLIKPSDDSRLSKI
jgi:hypothetical protein